MKIPLLEAIVQACRKLRGLSGNSGAPASSQPRSCTIGQRQAPPSSQRQAPASRAEQIAAQLEGSTLCRDYTVCADDRALLGEGGQACAVRHVHTGGSSDFASPVTHCTATSCPPVGPLQISGSCILWLSCRVHHKREGKDYALKVFTKGPWALESQRSKVAALTHLQAVPNIVRHKAHGEHQGPPWLVET